MLGIQLILQPNAYKLTWHWCDRIPPQQLKYQINMLTLFNKIIKIKKKKKKKKILTHEKPSIAPQIVNLWNPSIPVSKLCFPVIATNVVNPIAKPRW